MWQRKFNRNKKPKGTALDRALRILMARDRSEHELRTKLREAGFEETDVDKAIEQVYDYGYLDDAKFAGNYIRSKSDLKGWGEQRIRLGLREAGVNNELVEEAFEKCEIEWSKLALEVYRNKFGEAPIEDQKDFAKRMRYMASRGHMGFRIPKDNED